MASVDEPVPAGGSVAALTGAASAALLALVCGVQQRKRPGVSAAELAQAERSAARAAGAGRRGRGRLSGVSGREASGASRPGGRTWRAA